MAKKSSMAVILAMSPKSQTSSGSGMSTTSIASPDQGGDAMAPGMDEQEPDADSEMPMEGSDAGEKGEDMLDIPKGFKPPGSAADGGMFTTTIRAQVMDGKLKVLAVGDMPIHAEGGGDSQQEEIDESATPSDEQPDQSQQPALSDEGAAMIKRSKDAAAAKKVFQTGR